MIGYNNCTIVIFQILVHHTSPLSWPQLACLPAVSRSRRPLRFIISSLQNTNMLQYNCMTRFWTQRVESSFQKLFFALLCSWMPLTLIYRKHKSIFKNLTALQVREPDLKEKSMSTLERIIFSMGNCAWNGSLAPVTTSVASQSVR